jgi:hypothetical protein
MAYRDVAVTEPWDTPTVSTVSQASLVFDFDFLTGNYREIDASSVTGGGINTGPVRPTSGFLYPRGDSSSG